MRKKRFSEEQIVAILKEGGMGIPVPELCRKYGVGQSTYYKWQAKYSGLTLSDLKRLKQLEEENRRLKQMYADISLEHRVLKDVVEKKLHVFVNGEG
jgi:putative transposase